MRRGGAIKYGRNLETRQTGYDMQRQRGQHEQQCGRPKRNEFASELESERGQKSFFKIAKQMVKERRDVTGASCMKDEDGNIVTDSRGVKEVWRTYMERLLNVENDWDGDVDCDKVEGECCPIMTTEVVKAVRAMKEGKAAGPSGVVVGMLMAAGDVGVQWLTGLCHD